MADDPDGGRRSRPLLRMLAAGRRSLCRPLTSACRRVRKRPNGTAFASITQSDGVARDREGSINYSIFAPEETSSGASDRTLSASPGNQDTYSRFSSLVQQECEPLYTVTFPAWMVEVYNDLQSFGRAARRLFLPENSIKSKLPYYRCPSHHGALQGRLVMISFS